MLLDDHELADVRPESKTFAFVCCHLIRSSKAGILSCKRAVYAIQARPFCFTCGYTTFVYVQEGHTIGFIGAFEYLQLILVVSVADGKPIAHSSMSPPIQKGYAAY
eukprot:6184836-Pleurochrysis_carterae.AAC.8